MFWNYNQQKTLFLQRIQFITLFTKKFFILLFSKSLFDFLFPKQILLIKILSCYTNYPRNKKIILSSSLMFRKYQSLLILISAYSSVSIKTSHPPLNSYKNLYISFPMKALNKHYSFSSSQGPPQTDYQTELSLLKNFSWKQKSYLSQAFEKYVACKEDARLLDRDERMWLEWGLYELSFAHKEAGNLDKAYKYLSDMNAISKKIGRKENISLALNYYEMTSILITQGNWIKAENCANEVSRICKLLGDDPDVKSLIIKNYHHLAQIEVAQKNQDKALELYNLILEKIDDVLEPARPYLLTKVYKEMGSIYSSRNDIDRTINSWERGLEVAIKHFGEDSAKVINFLRDLVEFLIEQKQFVRAEPYAQKSLQMTLEIFSNRSEKTALAYYFLGKIFFAKKDFPKALDSYNNAIEILAELPEDFSNLSPDAYFSMATTHHALGNHQKTSDFLAKASQALIKIYSKNDLNVADVFCKWAQELNALKILTESQEFFGKAIDIYKTLDASYKSQISSIYLALGEIASGKEDWNKALELFKESEKYLDPADSHNMKRVSEVLGSIRSRLSPHGEKKEHFPRQMQSFELAGDISPIVLNYWNTGEFYEKQDRLKEALEAYQMAAQIYERDPMKEESNAEVIFAKISQIKEKI